MSSYQEYRGDMFISLFISRAPSLLYLIVALLLKQTDADDPSVYLSGLVPTREAAY